MSWGERGSNHYIQLYVFQLILSLLDRRKMQIEAVFKLTEKCVMGEISSGFLITVKLKERQSTEMQGNRTDFISFPESWYRSPGFCSAGFCHLHESIISQQGLFHQSEIWVTVRRCCLSDPIYTFLWDRVCSAELLQITMCVCACLWHTPVQPPQHTHTPHTQSTHCLQPDIFI